MSRILRRGRQSRGQAIAEFALIAPIFLLLLFGIIEFGRYVYLAQILNNAAREGARYAIVHGSTSLCPSGPMPGGATNSCDPAGDRIRAVVSSSAIGVSSITQTLSWTDDYGNPSDNARGHTFVISVRAQFGLLVPIVPIPPVTIEGASSLVINH
jgi:hypothetical protein